MTQVAVDTSASVPYLTDAHPAHRAVSLALRGHEPVLTGHSLAETYSVLTRLAGDARLAPGDAIRLIHANFGEPAMAKQQTLADLLSEFGTKGIAGGAVYDGLVGLAARDCGLDLVTRDQRAATTYAALGLTYLLIQA